jgi:hypothetical protein
MNLEDLKTYLDYARRAASILGRRVLEVPGYPAITELDVLKDVVAEVKRLRLANRDIEIPGIKRAFDLGVIQGAVAYFRDKVKKDIMPVQFAKDDNLIIEPLYRPKIFNMDSFTVTWKVASAPAVVDLLAPGGTPGPYNLQTDRELIILTDIIALDPKPAVTELLITVDGETQRPVVPRKDWLAADVRVFELPFPVIADINLRIQGRVEAPEGTFTYLPIGVHVVLGSLHAKTLA